MSDLREGEVAVAAPTPRDAGLVFIGRIRTPWTSRDDAPKQGRQDGPVCRVEIFEPWVAALKGIEKFDQLDIVYWLHLSRRDLVLQNPKRDGNTIGTFALRSPARPKPDRNFAGQAGRDQRRHAVCPRAGLPGRDAVDRCEAQPLHLHAGGGVARQGPGGLA